MTDRPRTRAPWPPPECKTCGQADPTEGGTRCGAHLRNPGDRPPHCRLQPGARTDHPGFGHCKYHGGSTPAGRIQGRELMLAAQEADLEASLAELGYTQITDPYQVMLDLASRAKALEEWLAGLVAKLGQDLGSFDDKGAEQVRTQMALFERAMDRAFKFVEAIARLDIDERRVRVAEVQTVLLAQALDTALRVKAAGLTPTQIDVVGDALHEALAELEPAPT